MKRITLLAIISILISNSVFTQDDELTSSKLKSFTLLVNDYDEAIEFYVSALGFELVSDQKYGENMRWVSLKAPESDIQITLGEVSEEDKEYVGKQSGNSYPLMVLTVKDVLKTFESYSSKGVTFIDEPSQRPWGLGALFEDLYGNKIYLQTE